MPAKTGWKGTFFFSVSLKKRKLLVLISSIWAHRTIQLKIHEEVTGNKPKACAFTGVRSHTCTHSHTCLVLFPFFHDFRELYWLTIMFLRLTLVVTTTCQNLNPVFILKINVSHNGDTHKTGRRKEGGLKKCTLFRVGCCVCGSLNCDWSRSSAAWLSWV